MNIHTIYLPELIDDNMDIAERNIPEWTDANFSEAQKKHLRFIVNGGDHFVKGGHFAAISYIGQLLEYKSLHLTLLTKCNIVRYIRGDARFSNMPPRGKVTIQGDVTAALRVLKAAGIDYTFEPYGE
jgi:hypothetical protein